MSFHVSRSWKSTELKVFFADPYAAWQRGTYENTNGLLRFYFLKGTDFGQVEGTEPRRLSVSFTAPGSV